MLAIAGFGLVDDILSLKPSTKLIVQIAVASALLFFGYRLHWTDSLIVDTMLTLVWIVGITNALQPARQHGRPVRRHRARSSAPRCWSTFVRWSAGADARVYLAALLGATAGFLVYNFHPASIFMGDSGSLFLGLNFAALTLIARPTARRPDVERAVDRRRPGAAAADSDFRHDAGDGHAAAVGPTRRRRAAATTRRIVWSRSGLSERTAVAVLWVLAALGGGLALSAPACRPELDRASPRRRFCSR